MGIWLAEFRLYLYACHEECAHVLLLRVNRPSYPNYDQTAEDAAEAFADSAADHLRTWWERWLLPRECRREHQSQLTDVVYDSIGDELEGPGLHPLRVWIVDVDGEKVLVAAATEDVLWSQVEDHVGPESADMPRKRSVAHDVYFLTEQSGRLDLRDA
jgi:hypothetical protein